MSAVSTSRPKKSDPLAKRIPQNPRYKNVRATIDTGASITKYMEKIDEIRQNYRYTKGEIFKRMKVTTFVQLITQVIQYNNDHDLESRPDPQERPDTADLEVLKIQRGEGDRSPAPSLAVTEGDYGEPINRTGGRSTLQGVIRGEGELDGGHQKSSLDIKTIMDSGCPYLLLDVRDGDSFNQCHIISALNYPKAMLSRSVNYETQEMLSFKNKEGKIIILYDDDERTAPTCATTLVQREYDNIFVLSGGLKVAYKIFPSGLITGSPPSIVTGSETPASEIVKAESNKKFSQDDLDNMMMYLDQALEDKSTGSRLSRASTTSSRMSKNLTKTERQIQNSVQSGRITGRTPFK